VRTEQREIHRPRPEPQVSVRNSANRGEQGDRLLRPALLLAQAGEAHSTAQFRGLCVLSERDLDALLDGRLSASLTVPAPASKASPMSR
jgi:hypothetical protein